MKGPGIQHLFSLRGWMSQVVFDKLQNHEGICSNASEGMDLLSRKQQVDREHLLLLCPSYTLPTESEVQIKCLSPQSLASNLKELY